MQIEELFWDVDFETLDKRKYKKFIITRVLEKGRVEHLRWLFREYDFETIKQTIKNSYTLSKNIKNFWLNIVFKYHEKKYIKHSKLSNIKF